jgi:hypothetical protein
MLPLFVAYELGLWAAGPDGPRNAVELALGQAFAPLGWSGVALRLPLLLAAALAAFVHARLAAQPLARSLLRTLLEGLCFALLLGPLLFLLVSLCGVDAADLCPVGRPGPLDVDAARAARALGAGAYEELAFRVGGYGAFFVLARAGFGFLGAGEAVGRWFAEGVAALASALSFAASHLDAATRFLGLVGEGYDPRLFLWRTLAGLFFALVFRWRGPGVAAWSHGLFNLALILGSGPGLLR